MIIDKIMINKILHNEYYDNKYNYIIIIIIKPPAQDLPYYARRLHLGAGGGRGAAVSSRQDGGHQPGGINHKGLITGRKEAFCRWERGLLQVGKGLIADGNWAFCRQERGLLQVGKG